MNAFRNITVSNNLNNNNERKIYHKKGESFHATSHHKNNFLNTGYVTTTKGNLNSNMNNITGINFMKSSRKKNAIKYTSSLLSKQDEYNNKSKPSNQLGSSSLNKLQKSANFLHPASSQELIGGLHRKISRPRINSSTGNKTTTNSGHVKSLSYNFDMNNNGLNTVRPKSSKKITYNSSNNDNKKKPFKDFRFELNEILQKRSVSKSSRATDLKGGFKYQTPMNNMNNNFAVRYTNKIIKG